MSDTDRYYSLLKRQEKKLAHAPKIARAFAHALGDLGPNPTHTALAAWMNGREKPSAASKSKKGWTAQTVADWLNFDGIEPTEANVRSLQEDLDNSETNEIAHRMRKYGSRVAAVRCWMEVREDVRRERGLERCQWEEQRLAQHLMRISAEARSLRAALNLPH